jgi:hypothetical protein
LMRSTSKGTQKVLKRRVGFGCCCLVGVVVAAFMVVVAVVIAVTVAIVVIMVMVMVIPQHRWRERRRRKKMVVLLVELSLPSSESEKKATLKAPFSRQRADGCDETNERGDKAVAHQEGMHRERRRKKASVVLTKRGPRDN